jgi:hypothetical protein
MSGALRGSVPDELLERVRRELAQLGWLLVHAEEGEWRGRPLVPMGQLVSRASWAELLELAELEAKGRTIEEVCAP